MDADRAQGVMPRGGGEGAPGRLLPEYASGRNRAVERRDAVGHDVAEGHRDGRQGRLQCRRQLFSLSSSILGHRGSSSCRWRGCEILASYGAAPVVRPEAPSSRTPRAVRPGCRDARGCAPSTGTRWRCGDGRRGRGAASDAFRAPAALSGPALVAPPAAARSRSLPRHPVPAPPRAPMPPPDPPPGSVPVATPISTPTRAFHRHRRGLRPCPRRRPRGRTPAVPADRLRALARPPAPGRGRSAGADPRTLPRLNPPAATPRRRRPRPRCSGASGCRR